MATNRKRSKEARTRGADLDAPLNRRSTRVKRTRGGLIGMGGRPTDYTDELLPTVRLMARGGATVHEIAQALGVTRQTLNNWAAQHEAFFAALYVDGKSAYDDRIEATMAERALGYSFESEKVFSNGMRMKVIEHVPPDVGAAKMWLSSRRPDKWRDKTDLNIGGELKVESAGDRELALATIALIRGAAERGADATQDDETHEDHGSSATDD